ncbi:MAG: ribonuclease R [Bacteroidales bacterium]|jgi:ribonuclease R|nr:ribonuclease R [Bacteroidales bacterium]
MKKKSNPSANPFVKNILSEFANNPYSSFNYKQIAKRMGVKDQAGKIQISVLLNDLLKQKILIESKKGKYQISSKHISNYGKGKSYTTGKVDMLSTGKAYVINNEGGDDIFISSNNTKDALNGDKVKVFIFPKRSGRKLEGQILEVLERAKTKFVGLIQISKGFGFVVPDDPKIPVDFFIPKDKLNGAKNGQKVVIELDLWPEHAKNPFGKIVQVLGDPGNHGVEIQSIVLDYNFDLTFADHIEKAATQIPNKITAKEIAKRRDFRDVFTITIDPFDAKDFDDAISLRKTKNNLWEVGVHIADVSHYVTEGSVIDTEAYERATSIYLVDRVIPMLPEHLSNLVCSLRPDEEKLTFSAVFEMDDDANIHSEWYGRTVINSNHRFTYEEVQTMIEGEEGPYKEDILTFHSLSSKLREERFKKGSINFESVEVKFKLDEKSNPIGVYIKEQKEAHRLIEDFMLLANKKVAEFIGKAKGKQKAKPFVYRVHDEPSPEKLNTFAKFVSKLGYEMNISSRQNIVKSYNNLFKAVAGKGEKNMIETIAIRTMAKAIYSTENNGHYGLSFPFYTHFTSPIRRYPDLMVHRLLAHYLEGGSSVKIADLEEKCKHSSDMERNAIEAERASVKYMQAVYMFDKVGQKFEGQISGVSKWGIYVELIESKVEGMVRMKDMEDDFYFLDEENYQVMGQKFGKKYKLGDKIRIQVKNIDVQKKQIDYLLVQ